MKTHPGGVIGANFIGVLTIVGFVIGANLGFEFGSEIIGSIVKSPLIGFFIGGLIGGLIGGFMGGFIGYIVVKALGIIVWGTVVGALLGYAIGFFIISSAKNITFEEFIWVTIFAVTLSLMITYVLKRREKTKNVPERIF